MSAAGLLFALALPMLIGKGLLAACVGDPRTWREPGIVPWTGGAAWIAGVLVLTLVMRADAWLGVPFGIVSIGVPGVAIAAAALVFAWRRNGSGWRDAIAETGRVLLATDLPRGARVTWFALLAWIAVRAVLLLVEVASRPLFAWDAWSAWATKAKTYFALGTIVPFVDAARWAESAAPVWFDAAPGQPATLPLLQAWVATAMGRWDDARVDLPWWLFLVSIILVVYGEMRRRGAPALVALVAAWLAGSLPLLGTQVALAGYADLPLAAAFTLGTLAGLRAIETRAPLDIAAACAGLAAAVLMKSSGWAWVVVAMPGFAAAVLGPAWTRRIAIAVAAIAIGVVGVAARFTQLAIGPVSLAYGPVFDALAIDGVLLANFHLLAVGVLGTVAFTWRRLLAPGMAPLSLVVAAGAGWIAMLAAFPSFRQWGADTLGINRAVLVIAPVVVVWMVVAFRTMPAPAAGRASGDVPPSA